MTEKMGEERKESAETQKLNFFRNQMKEDVTRRIEEIVFSFKGDVVSTKFPNYIRNALEKEFGEGWNVFSGRHFSGVCHFVEGYFAEFEVGDSIVVVFKSYIPPK